LKLQEKVTTSGKAGAGQVTEIKVTRHGSLTVHHVLTQG